MDFEDLRCIGGGVACNPSVDLVCALFFGKIDFVKELTFCVESESMYGFWPFD
jgi:hypothetical protein